MSRLEFAAIVAGVVFVCSAPALWLFVRWHARRVGELHRQAYVYGVQALPGESYRKLRRRVAERVGRMFASTPGKHGRGRK